MGFENLVKKAYTTGIEKSTASPFLDLAKQKYLLLSTHTINKVHLSQLAQHLSKTDHHGLGVEQHSNTRAG